MNIGVQTKNIIDDKDPAAGFALMTEAGFTCADFSLNAYLVNNSIYKGELNSFFDKTAAQLEDFFAPHKKAAKDAGIVIHQMHMPYPVYVPGQSQEVNAYLWDVVAAKSMQICAFFHCRYIVIHGLKLAYYLGSEEREWEQTARFLEYLAPMAKDMGITLCVENLYNSVGGHLVEGPCCNAKKAVERIDSFNEKYGAEVLGFCFDTGHANLVGLDFEDFLTTLGGRLKVLHIHDNDGRTDQHQIPFTFSRSRENKTSTDWAGFLRGLKKINFDSTLSFETAPALSTFPEALKEDALRLISRVGAYFMEELKRQP